MSEDIELLRLRARAKAKAERERAGGSFEQPKATQSGTLPDRMQALATGEREKLPQETLEAKLDEFSKLSLLNQALSGAGKAAYMTGPGLVKRLWGKGKDVDDLSAEHELVAQNSPAAFLGELAGDIALTAIPATKMGKFAKFLTGAPAKKLPQKILQKVTQAGITGSPAVGIHQAQQYGATGELNPAGAGIETGLNVAIPLGGSAVKKATQGLGDKIVQTATKLSKKIKGQKTMNPDQLDEYFRNYSSWRGIKGSAEKISERENELGLMFDELMDGLAAGTKVDIGTAISNARSRTQRAFLKAEMNLDDFKPMMRKLKDFENMTMPLLDEKGVVTGDVAQRFKQNTLDVLAKYDKPTPFGTFDPALSGAAKAARATRQELSKQLEYLNPEFKNVNQAYSKMASIRPFIEDAMERAKANRGLSLQDITTAGIGLAGLGVGYGTGNEKIAAAGLLPFLASRGQKSPGVAHAMNRAGGLAGALTSDMPMHLYRSGLGMALQNPYIQDTIPGIAGENLRGEQ